MPFKPTLHALLFAGGLLFGSQAARAQASPVPATYSFAAAADYARYDQQIIATVNWLEKVPAGQQPEQRKEAGRFLIQWLTGTPDVSVQLSEYFMKLCPKDSDALLLFMGGWSRYQLQHPTEKDNVTLNTEGLKTVLQAYQLSHGKTNKKLESLLPLLADGSLSAWVAKELKG